MSIPDPPIEIKSLDTLRLERNPTLEGLDNPKVLNSILSHLPFEDALNCSLVQKTWRSSFTQQNKKWKRFKILIQLAPLKSEIEEESDSSRLTLKMASEIDPDLPIKFFSVLSLDRLQETLTLTSQKVIWVVLNIGDSHPKPLFVEQLKKLFDLIRPYLTRLVIDGNGFFGPPEESINFMLLDSPQLKRVRFCVPLKNLTISLPPDPLTQLQVLTLRQDPGCSPLDPDSERSTTLLAGILEKSPNIQQIFNMPILHKFFLTDDSEVNQEFLIKVKSIGYQLKLTTTDLNEELIVLTKIAPVLKLQNLTVKWFEENTIVKVSDWKNCYENFGAIFESSAETLKDVQIYNTSFVPYLTFPLLPRLTSLSLHSKGIDDIKVFRHFPSTDFQIREKFPHLNSLELFNLSDVPSHMDQLLPPELFAPREELVSINLKYLKLRDRNLKDFSIFKQIIQKLALYFPLVENLNVGQDWCWLEEFLPCVWTGWPDLCELTTEIRSRGSKSRSKCLDEVITGIQESRCRELRKCRQKVDIDLEVYRTLPAVSHMTHLRRWSILLSAEGHQGERSSPPMLTHVSTFYGFQLVPDLVVDLRVSNEVIKSQR